MEIPLVFVEPRLGAVGFPGGPGFSYLDSKASSATKAMLDASAKWEDEQKRKLLGALEKEFPDLKLKQYDVDSVDSLEAFLAAEKDAVGYLLVDLQGPSNLVGEIFRAGKPVVFIGEALGGGGDYLLYHARGDFDRYPVVGTVTRDLASPQALRKVNYLLALEKLKQTQAVVISNRDLSSIADEAKRATGIRFSLVSGDEFADKYYHKVTDDEARPVAESWIKSAAFFPEESAQRDEVMRSARLYIAMNEIMRDYKANAITIDCLGLRSASSTVLDAWPCLGYMQLWLDGSYVPMCEADINSLVVALMGKYLLGVNGSATDPVTDEVTGQLTYYHCYLPINPLPGLKLKYSIIPAHMGTRYAAVNAEYPVGSPITAVGIDLGSKTMNVHVSKVEGNELSLPACGTKVIGRSDVKAIARNWRSGWHRVVLLGDHRDEVNEFGRLLGLKVINEDLSRGSG